MVMVTSLSFAQNTTVTGKVISDEDQQPIIGANIVVVGTTQGTVSDFDGNYSIDVPPDGKLIFSFIDYQSVELPVNRQTQINVSLKTDQQLLDDVVVVG